MRKMIHSIISRFRRHQTPAGEIKAGVLPLLFTRKNIGKKLSPLQERLLEVQSQLNAADEKHGNVRRALNHAKLHDLVNLAKRGYVDENSRMRLLVQYSTIHTLLETISGGKLAGRKILHLAASTGVYARFLQDQMQASVVALDLDLHSLKHSREHGVRRNIVGEAVHHKNWIKYSQNEGGIPTPKYIPVHLPFLDKSLDFVVSEHFLFSNYHKGADAVSPGFENRDGSIQKSENTLKELNRVLRLGGRVIIAQTHEKETPLLRRYQQEFSIHGFVVEVAYDGVLKPIKKGKFPKIFVLRKTKDIG